MYTELSEVYDGELGFEEATNLMLAGNSPINHQLIRTTREFERLVRNFTFWDWKDSSRRPMRIEYSGWILAPIETQVDQRVSVIERMFKQFWSIATSYYSSTYSNNPQMFGEFGTRDIDGSVLGPDFFYSIPKNRRMPDEQERSDVMYATLKASKELGIERLNAWLFFVGDHCPNWENGNAMNTGFKQPGSPVYRIVKAVIGRN